MNGSSPRILLEKRNGRLEVDLQQSDEAIVNFVNMQQLAIELAVRRVLVGLRPLTTCAADLDKLAAQLVSDRD